jgi:hypothetical protein
MLPDALEAGNVPERKYLYRPWSHLDAVVRRLLADSLLARTSVPTRSNPGYRRPALMTLSMLAAVLGGCQVQTYGVVLNRSGTDIELSFHFNRIPNPPLGPICAGITTTPLKSDKRYGKAGKIKSSFKGWSPDSSGQSDESGCGLRNIRLQPGQAMLIGSQVACDDFQSDVKRRGVDISKYTAPFASLTARSERGTLTLENWDVTSRFRRTKSDVCVLEITMRDLRS